MSSYFQKKLCEIIRGRWCGYCASKKLCTDEKCDCCKEKSFASCDPIKVACFDTLENGVNPRDIFKCSSIEYIFNCYKCPHSFKKRPADVTRGEWCPYCGCKILCNDEKCGCCKEKSFASYIEDKVACFDTLKNGINPRDIFKNSTNVYSFNCDKCPHSFRSSLNNIVNGENWCPYCAHAKLCDDDKCDDCMKKSFASFDPVKVACFDIFENGLTPRDVFKNSSIAYSFNCDKCPHSFRSILSNITSDGTWCPYCAHIKLCGAKDCKECEKNSFASYDPIKVACFNIIKNGVNPRDVFKGSAKLYFFVCEKNHEFEIRPNNITSDGQWCNQCFNKTEAKMLKWLKGKFDEEIIHQAKFDLCRSEKNRYLRFDFKIEDLKIIIEVDGAQHFRQISNWKSPEETLKGDIYKMKFALTEGYTVIRIFQEDIWKDKNDWESKTLEVIKKYEKPCLICIGCPDMYRKHIEGVIFN